MKWWARLANSLLKEFAGSMRAQYGIASDTDRGERVKSKGEKKVADFLNERGIRYQYECKIIANGRSYQPDFFLPDYKAYIEYAGMWENFADYRNKCYRKFEDYEKAGLRLVVVFPQDLEELDGKIGPMIC